ncbi:MAG: ATP-binding cassette domain-containing protein [Sphingobacteriia bacterium]|nr:MAG: ATP-binding cassette domain-containing protein [Sphingobacteriia bacterium]
MFAILAGLVSLALPLGIQTIISFVMAGSFSTSIVILIFLVVGATFITGLLQIRQMQLTEKIQQKIFVRYSLEFADRLPKMNIEKLDKYYLPELVNRFFDTVSLQKGIEKLLLDIPTAVIQILFGVILLSFYHPVFIGFGAILVMLLYIILSYTMPDGFQASIESSNHKYETAGWLEEMARVIKTFKYSRGTELNIKKTDGFVKSYLDAKTHYFRILLTQYWSIVGFKVLITAAMLIVGSILLVDQQINIGQFIAADLVIITVISSVEKLILNLDKVYDVMTSVEKLSKITESELESEGTIQLQDSPKGVSLEFNQVGFSYDGKGKQVLKNISFSVLPGQKVCIMGESGSGKSSVLRLLTGAFHHYQGSILIDNIPIGNFKLASLRSQTGILLSQQDIFNGTIWENITMGNENITHGDISDLVTKCGLDSFIQSMPMGYDTVLDPTGNKLSSKVRQDILLLRALIGKRRLLLLEQPFQHLEAAYRNQVQNFILSDDQSTVLLATNDQQVAQACDLVIVLEAGGIKAQGNWKDVSNYIN